MAYKIFKSNFCKNVCSQRNILMAQTLQLSKVTAVLDFISNASVKKIAYAGFSIRAGSRRNSPAIPHEITTYLIEKLPHILRLTGETFATKHEPWIGQVLQEKQKNVAYILSNFSGDLCFLFCSNTLILAPECRRCILSVPNFQNFPGEHTPGLP